jgi:hypothetical protein
MWRKCLVISLILACFTMPGPGFTWESPWAPCQQQDLEGIWDAEVWAGDASGTQCWDQCTLSIDAGGLIASEGTYTTCMGETSSVIGGQLTMNGDCELAGTIETSECTIYVERGAIGGNQLFLGVSE